MKKHSKKLISALLSLGVIASSIGASLSASAADVKVQMVQNYYYKGYVNNKELKGYFILPDTEKNGRYFNQTEYNYYKNTVDAGNYFRSLGFNYSNTAVFYCGFGVGLRTATSNTVYISHTNDDGSSNSSSDGYVFGGQAYKDLSGDAVSEFGMIVTGPADHSYMADLEYAPDIIAHEYVHLITQQLVGWGSGVRNSSIEAGAVVEAYSDILGELSTPNPDWKMGTILFYYNTSGNKCVRNLRDPHSTLTPKSRYEYLSRPYYDDYYEFKYDTDKVSTNTYYYAASTILSHAAYLMSTKNIDKDVLAQIWYDSITQFRNPSAPTMSDCRQAVIKAAENYCNNKHYSTSRRNTLLNDIRNSFNQVCVY